MKRSQLEKHLEELASEIQKTEATAGIHGLKTEYPYASEIEQIRETYFAHPNVEERKKLIGLRIALSKAFIDNAKLNLHNARKELNKAKYKGPKARLAAAVLAILIYHPVYDSYGVAGTITALFCLYMIASYFDHSWKVDQEEELSTERDYFDECRNQVFETEKETRYFIDAELDSGEPSKFYDLRKNI